jgi:hypothetical protein
MDVFEEFEEVRHSDVVREVAMLRSVLTEREAELLEVKGPCRAQPCPLHYAHRGPCA